MCSRTLGYDAGMSAEFVALSLIVVSLDERCIYTRVIMRAAEHVSATSNVWEPLSRGPTKFFRTVIDAASIARPLDGHQLLVSRTS